MKKTTMRDIKRLLGAQQLLSAYCQSDNLCVDGLRKRIDHFVQIQDIMDLSTSTGRLLLHHACMNERVSEEIVRLLIDSFPGAAGGPVSREKDFQPLPLHVACWNQNTTAEIVRLLVDAFPQSVRRQSVDGGMPLHYLCRGDCADSVNVLRLLLEEYPEAIEHVTQDGFLPIHLACLGSKSSEFCHMLNEAYPILDVDSFGEPDAEVIPLGTSEYLERIYRLVKAHCGNLS